MVMKARVAFLVGIGGALAACARGDAPPPPAASAGTEAELTPFQIENGIGPITSPVELGAIDQGLVSRGATVFETRCSACHKMDERYVGPALGEVTTRRTPAFIMNMILNPQEMVERHPVAKQLLAEHMTMMANQNLTPEEARAVLEYLRTRAKP